MLALASFESSMWTKPKSFKISHSITLPNFSKSSLSSELRAATGTLPT
jgi:hypothetical protein